MNTQDDLAWKREFEHVEERQKQREGSEGKQSETWVGNVRTASAWTYTTSHSEQFNED